MNQGKVPLLKKLAAQKIAQNAHQLTNFNFGLVPFHLVLPTLSRLNAKQLSQVEEINPMFTPDSDQLWKVLLEKDFPQRPSNPPRTFVVMPHKTLHGQYTQDRDLLREDSTQKLRVRIEKLNKRRLANQIVQVEGLLRDPTVKPSFSGYNGTRPLRAVRGKPTTILEKVRKDLDNRKSMFPLRMRRYENLQVKPFKPMPMKPVAKLPHATPKLTSPSLPKTSGAPADSHFYNSLVLEARREDRILEKQKLAVEAARPKLFILDPVEGISANSNTTEQSNSLPNTTESLKSLSDASVSHARSSNVRLANELSNQANAETPTEVPRPESPAKPTQFFAGVPLAPETRKKLQDSMFLKRKPAQPIGRKKRAQIVEPDMPSKIKRIKSSVFM